MRKKINIFILSKKLADYVWANNEVSVRKLGIGSKTTEKIFRDFSGSPVVKTLRCPLQRAWVWFLAVELGFRLLKKIKKDFIPLSGSQTRVSQILTEGNWLPQECEASWKGRVWPAKTVYEGWDGRASPPSGSPCHLLSPAPVCWGHLDAPRGAASCSLRCRMILLVNLLGLLTTRQRHDLGTYFSQVDLHH